MINIREIRSLKFTLLIICVLLGISGLNGKEPSEALEELICSKGIDREQFAISVISLDDGKPVVSFQTARALVPASIMKCITTASLRSTLPYFHQIRTNVYYQGEIADGILEGNIVIVGAADPSLGDGRHEGQENLPDVIANRLKELKIKEIKGEILIDDEYLAGPATHPTWQKADLSQSYGTGSHAFNFEGNASGKSAVTNPGNVFRKRLADALTTAGISISPKTKDHSKADKTLLYSHRSPMLEDLMRSCMFRSDNLYAETFLRLYGVKNGEDGSTNSAARLETEFWKSKSYPLKGVEIVDGSGLSRSNRMTADFMSRVLTELKEDPVYVSFFPLVGAEGTLRNFLKGTSLQEYMCLKSGSMSGIQCYAGYLLDESFIPTHAVVVMANGLKNRQTFKEDLENFFLSIFPN